MSISDKLIDWVERGYVPDALTRVGIRRLLRQRLANVDQGNPEANRHEMERLIHEFCGGSGCVAARESERTALRSSRGAVSADVGAAVEVFQLLVAR